MRLFFALEVEPSILDDFAAVQRDLEASGLRLIPCPQVHLGLVFLGEVSVPQIEALNQAVLKPVTDAFPLRLQVLGLRRYKSGYKTRVVYAIVRDREGDLAELQDNLAYACRPFVNSREQKPFRPYLVLARGQRERPTDEPLITTAMARWRKYPFGDWHPNELVLFRTVLSEQGLSYVPVNRYR